MPPVTPFALLLPLAGMLRLILTLSLLAGADAAFGRKKEKDGATRMGEELNAEAEQNSGDAPTGNAREWELENAARHKTGELNSAELGMANMQQAMKDPSVMAETMKMMQDPEAQRKIKEMMADPTFQAQAQQAMAAMKQSGGMEGMGDIGKMLQDPEIVAKARQMAQSMGLSGGAGMPGMGGGGGGAEAELARLRAENNMLKAKAEL
eukprot:scaffold2016_cov63-Phaeocystis_antarctica.AAC.2